MNTLVQTWQDRRCAAVTNPAGMHKSVATVSDPLHPGMPSVLFFELERISFAICFEMCGKNAMFEL